MIRYVSLHISFSPVFFLFLLFINAKMINNPPSNVRLKVENSGTELIFVNSVSTIGRTAIAMGGRIM